MLLRAWQRQLEQDGFDVLLARSAPDAASVLARVGSDFDAVVCDLHMAGGGGIDLYRFLEAQYPGMQLRVVFITGAVFSTEEDAFLRTTGQPVLDKPCRIDELAAIVRGWATRP